MEEFDDLVPTPDESGVLELTYRAWKVLDDVVWTMGKELVKLNVSFNSIKYLPPELGDLMRLRELNVACNAVPRLPSQLGKLRNLEVLKVNGNKLTQLPDTLGNCTKLEEIVASENALTSFPDTVGKLTHLRLLRLQNNNLRAIPYQIAHVSATLREVDVSGNLELAGMVPSKLQGDTQFILWVCGLHSDHNADCEQIRESNEELKIIIARGNEGAKQLRKQLNLMQEERMDLLKDRPEGLINAKAACVVS